MEWATLNDVEAGEVESIFFGTTCSGETVPDTVSVRLVRTQRTFFASIFGTSSGDLHVCATARTGMAQGGPGLFPIGLLYDDPELASDPPLCYFHETDSTDPDEPHANFWYDPGDADSEECTIKIPKPNETWTPGNSGPLRLDEGGETGNWIPGCNPGSSGSSEYTENLVEGSECGYSLGDEIRTKTGSMNSLSCAAVDDKIDGNTDPITEVFVDTAPVDGIYDIVDDTHPRFALIPVVIVPAGASGSSTVVEIHAFVPVYIVGCTESDSGGNTVANTVVIPVRANIYVEGIDFVEAGDLDDFSGDWPLWTIKLVE
jgi:hypothetical protein